MDRQRLILWPDRIRLRLRVLQPRVRAVAASLARHDLGAYVGAFLKYDLERTLLAAALVFVILVAVIPEVAGAPAVQGLLAIFATDTPHLKISGLLGLSLAVVGLCWLLNELALAWYPPRTPVGRRWQLRERRYVPGIAFGVLVAPWLLEWLPRPLGDQSGPLALLSAYLLLQLAAAAAERMPVHGGTTNRTPTASSQTVTPRRQVITGLVLAPIVASLRGLPARSGGRSRPPAAAAPPPVADAPIAARVAPVLAATRPVYQDVRHELANAGRHSGRMGAVRWLAVHHSATVRGDAHLFVAMHPHWANAPYHYVILPDGTIQWLQDHTIPSFHAGFDTDEPGMESGQLYNNHAISICLVGNFDVVRPAAAQLDALRWHLADLMIRYALTPDRILGHNELRGAHRTVCPGRYLEMRTLRAEVSPTRTA